MKKALMTFVAVGFSFTFAFAQNTTPVQNNNQDIQVQEQQAEVAGQDQATKREVKMKDLPVAVQEAFKGGEYSQMEVLAIYLKPSSADEEPAVFEFELVKAEEATSSAGTPEEGLDGVELERVSERQPDTVLQINENGEVLEEKDLDEEKEEK
jgi:hypothetical protein